MKDAREVDREPGTSLVPGDTPIRVPIGYCEYCGAEVWGPEDHDRDCRRYSE